MLEKKIEQILFIKNSPHHFSLQHILIFFSRIYAVAVHGNTGFGTGESHFVACLPIMVRPTLPRFLNYGDKSVEITTVIQNQTDRELAVTLVARGNNVDFVHGDNRVTEIGVTDVKVPANLRQKISFFVDAKLAGKAHVQLLAAIVDLNNKNNGKKIKIQKYDRYRSVTSGRCSHKEYSSMDSSYF